MPLDFQADTALQKKLKLKGVVPGKSNGVPMIELTDLNGRTFHLGINKVAAIINNADQVEKWLKTLK